jgi:serine protease
VTPGVWGAGQGDLRYSVDSNLTGVPRSGIVTAAGLPFTLTQNGIGAPRAPSNPYPPHGATSVSATVVLQWTGDIAATSYDLYFGTTFPPPLFATMVDTHYQFSDLLGSNTAYNWRVVAKNGAGWTSSPGWVFITNAYGRIDTIVSPVPGSSLSDAPVTFCWTDVNSYVHWLDVGTAPGIGDLSGWAQPAGRICKTITDPGSTLGNGGTVYVTIRSLINGAWYPAPGSSSPGTSASYTAPLHSFWPPSGTVFTSSSVMFSWAPIAGAAKYWLDVGPVQGNGSIFGGYVTGTSQLVTNITPTGGSIWARLWVYKNGALQQPPTDYQYTACNHCVATINSPPVTAGFIPGSVVGTLPGSTAQFCWDTSQGADAYFLDVGTIPGQGNIYGVNQGLGTCQTVSGMPTAGIVQVQVTTHRDGDWKRPAMQYRNLGADSTVKVTSPTPGSTLPSSTVTFSWTPILGADHYWLDVGTVQGQGNIYAADQGTATSRTVTGIPAGTIWVRLWTFYGGIMVPVDFWYTS